MTIAERKRAHRLIRVSETYGAEVIAKITLPIFTALEVIIVGLGGFVSYKGGNTYDIIPLAVIFSFMTYFFAMFSCLFAGDGYTAIKDMPEVYHGSASTGKFFCTLPFEAGDLLNVRIIRWEQCTAINAVLYIAVQIASMIMEATGSPMYHSYCGMSFIFAVWTAAVMFCGTLIRGLRVFGLGIAYGVSFAAYTGVLSKFEDDLPAIARLDETMPALGALYGVSGILLYIAALIVIDIIGQFAVKKRKDVSWRLK